MGTEWNAPFVAPTLITFRIFSSSENRRLLHQSILRGDEEASSFLISRGADVNLMTSLGHETPLHLASAFASEGELTF